MHIVLFFPDRLPVRGYGGTQRMLVRVGRALAERGHRITVVCGQGSELPFATVIPIDARRARAGDFSLDPHLPDNLDIVCSFIPVHRPPSVPWVWRLAGNLRPGRTAPPNTIYVSSNHAERNGSRSFVLNGVDPTEFAFQPRKASFDLFLGRLHRVKGYRWAIEGARRARRKLLLAGGWRPSFRPGIRYIGMVDGARKRQLLADARCLWMPALWDEPCAGVLLESLMSGTPVLGTRRGCLPEIVSPNVGILGDSVDELVEGAARIDRIDPAACRARAERWFSSERMASEYERFFQHYVRTGVLPEGEPAGT